MLKNYEIKVKVTIKGWTNIQAKNENDAIKQAQACAENKHLRWQEKTIQVIEIQNHTSNL